ncbi:MAG: hypothetical protein KGK07_04055 [Chloroflexota bacterium]|nr:hypothetical protein [Chloroflexota bacterium]
MADSVGVTCIGGPAGTATAVPALAQPLPEAPAAGVVHDRAPSLDTAHDGGTGVGQRGAICGSTPDGAPGAGAMQGGGEGGGHTWMHGGGQVVGAGCGSLPGAPGAGRMHGGGGHVGATCGSTPGAGRVHGGGHAGAVCGSMPGPGTPHGGGIGQACSTAGVAGSGSTHGSGGGQAGAICGSMPDGAPGAGRMHGGGGQAGARRGSTPGGGPIAAGVHARQIPGTAPLLSGVRVAGCGVGTHHGGRQVVLPPAGACTQTYGPAGRAPG